VGLDNIFICGHKTHELQKLAEHYNPWDYYHGDPELRRVIDSIRDNEFVPEEGPVFGDIYRTLMEHGDVYFHLADYRSYIQCQSQVSEVFRDQQEWARRAVLNVARMGKFSSDRTIREYADEIWKLRKLHVKLPEGTAQESFGPEAD
jgi:starch phosphorylase